MKKTLFIIFTLSGFVTSAQAYYERAYNNHEFRFNMGRFLATTAVEGSYEYYFTPDTSIGGTVFFNGDALGQNGDFGIGPNLRAYFGYKPKSGMFAEAFGLYYTGQNDFKKSLGIRDYEYSTMAFGFGLGKKWSTFGEKFTFELSAGLGRNINPQEFQNTFMFRSGVSLGIRL